MEKANLSDPEHKTKTGVSAVKINFVIFLSLIFSMLKNKTALILQSVTSQVSYQAFDMILPLSSFIFALA